MTKRRGIITSYFGASVNQSNEMKTSQERDEAAKIRCDT